MTRFTRGVGLSPLEGETHGHISPVFRSQDTLKPLPFDAAKLTGFSQRAIRSHWENNYRGSVKALGVKARLAQAAADKDLPPYV